MDRRLLIAKGLRDASPIILAYFPIAVTFGVISTSSGVSPTIVFLISALVYAGAAQFILVGLALTGISASTVIATVLLSNLRHFLYGTTLGPTFAKWPERLKWVSAFGLTDEVFAVTSSQTVQEPPSPVYHFTFVFACYGSWLIGTIVGASVGTSVPPTLSQILTFSLPALFLALLLSSYRTWPCLIAALSGGVLAIVAQLLNWGGLGVILGATLGATIGMLSKKIPVIHKKTGNISKC